MTDLTKLSQKMKELRETAGLPIEGAAARLLESHDWDDAEAIVRDFEDPLRITGWLNSAMFLYYLLEIYCRPEDLRQTYRDCSVLAGYLVPKERPCSSPSA